MCCGTLLWLVADAIVALCCCVLQLCLDGLGFKLRDAWKPQEELLFALGM
jgi:hypothetical protein